MKRCMLTKEQLKKLAKQNQATEFVVLREYLQVLFLQHLYSKTHAKNIFFKGDTAIRLLLYGTRFSEDLDFTVNMSHDEFKKFIEGIFAEFIRLNEGIVIKPKKSITGLVYVIRAKVSYHKAPIFIRLDFSLREKVLLPKSYIMETQYPVVFTNFVYSMDKGELLAEKIRALLTRNKPRDLYDLWFLLQLGAQFNNELVQYKLKYYGLRYTPRLIQKALNKFTVEDFIKDLRPFVTTPEKKDLAARFEYIREYVRRRLEIKWQEES